MGRVQGPGDLGRRAEGGLHNRRLAHAVSRINFPSLQSSIPIRTLGCRPDEMLFLTFRLHATRARRTASLFLLYI